MHRIVCGEWRQELLARTPIRAIGIAIAWAASASALCAQDADPRGRADRAAPRADENSMIAHGQLVEKAKRGRINIYFEGDSIVRRWGALDYPELLENWTANFYGWNAANFG